ncbi:hypothetical protein EV421DRAFT_1844141 [Armillaria borealis]|uniref:Uncharacterized protein n=1 Tax=Armillaria borealis TaxID=47425 RepID=A0AA39MGZ8_9AGAR|nr:hypothetical protein EV421DRAFT_1844141 [Armillaria borealis]
MIFEAPWIVVVVVVALASGPFAWSIHPQHSYAAFRHSIRLFNQALYRWSVFVHSMLRQNLKSSCLCAHREDLLCRYRDFT